MNKYYKIAFVISFVVFAIIGYLLVKGELSKDNDNQTFYAIIETVSNNSLLVTGIEENDINYRTKYSFTIKDTTVLKWRGTKIKTSDLKVGDRISITFNGPVLDSYPGQLTNVIKIEVLNDRLDQSQNKFTIVDETTICADALELFYEDENFEYYFTCMKSTTIFVVFNDGRKVTIKEAVNSNMITITELEEKLKDTNNKNIIYKQPK